MQRAEQVVQFLTSKRGRDFCDDCIAEALTPVANRHYIQSIANSLSKTNQYHRTSGRCSKCGGDKLVTRAT